MEEFEFTQTAIPDLKLIRFPAQKDRRGTFLKIFSAPSFCAFFQDSVSELFFSTSIKGAIRGMHFQIPPFDHVKLVFCLSGRIFDAVVDVRKGSPGYGKHVAIELLAENPQALLIPKGLAHGFQALTENSLVGYLTTRSYTPSHDLGINFSGAGVDWPLPVSEISSRDLAFPILSDFQSPFLYGAS